MPGYFSARIPLHHDGLPMATAERHDPTPHDPITHAPTLARPLILDELSARSLYKALRGMPV